MGIVYRLERTKDYRDEDGSPFYDVTMNGVVLLTRVRFDVASAQVAARIEDDDRYQEVFDGNINCDESGEVMKRGVLESGY
jgi:hypothetical protein